MKVRLLILIFVSAVFNGYSQFELPKKTLKIAPISNPSGQTSPTTSTSSALKYPSIFDKKDNLAGKISLLNQKPEETKSVMETEKFESQSKEYTDRLNKKSDGKILEKFKSDSFLGQFKVGTKIISIACRDHEAPDGDLVRIWLNDKMAVDAILLDVDFKEVYLELNEGINKIEIEALNQGESGPNTAQFVIYDQKKGTVTTNKWNLTTGVRAKIIILKEDGVLEEKK
ncbi:hypothetical protein [Flavobacterium macrobrachii]|uniref:Uncharacterized protein n=1 Tax=Flavobacterium macrobrachii TaxID=591204 RepID=A0ABS2CZ25_9FLAO|nr:hypothetical protein [Flavobacterium macrobrachii]MBM6500156.1 hypothetical protein [Flavobacterium macrobrachii]